MLGLFKKKKPERPVFENLNQSEYKDKYFYRTSPWDWFQDGMIHIFNINAPRVVTMDPWPQLVYLESTGQQTVSEFIYATAALYSKKEGVPSDLDINILDTLSSLVKDGLVILSSEKKQLEDAILLSKSELKSN